MKKLLTLITFICFYANAKAQYVNIPDSNFRNFLIAKYPSCFNSVGQMDTTCNYVITETFLYCASQNIVDLSGIKYFVNLQHLDCRTNKLINLSILPSSLQYLNCNANQLTILPVLPNALQDLDCGTNQLTSLPNLSPTLQNLYCSGNKLLNLPLLPNTLQQLYCDFNQLSTLPQLPSSLINLICQSNNLLTLPPLPNGIKQLVCSNNHITNIPALPNSIQQLSCTFNNITCLPKLPNSLLYFMLDYKTKILCIPNKPLNCQFTDAQFNTINKIAICNPANNSNNCQSFPTIQSYLHINNLPKKNVKLTLSNNNKTYTNTQGIAYINADSLGTYTITAQAPPLYKAVPASYTHTFNRYDTLVYDTFALQPLVTKDSLSIGITPTTWAARSGFKYAYNVGYENVGTTVVNTNLSVDIDTSKLVFDSASAGSFNGNNLSYSVSNFVPGQNGSLLVYCTVKPTAVLGSSLQAMATINGGSAIANDTVVTTIRGSFDPNDKQATPALSVAQVASNSKWIDYTIRFENTGSDTAFTVVVADTLDASKLQTGTVQLTGMSHPVKATQNDNIIFFEFRNINLPDSNIDKVKCNGFVSFKVKPLTSLVNGMTVPNKAAIYFDYNEPVITNTAQTVIGTLPLTLVNFSAIFKEDENKIFVYWNTANEINTSFFIIEQSIDGRGFAPAAEVAATGKGTNSYYYQLNANSQQPTVYLRLKMVDRNGAYTYSNIVKLVNNKEQLVIDVAPNPAKNILNIKASAALNNTAATITNAQGKTVKAFTLKQGYQIIDIAALPNGVYYLQSANGVSKFVVEK